VVRDLRARVREERGSFLRGRLDSIGQLTEAQRLEIETLMDDLLEKLVIVPAERLRGERELRRKIQNVEALRDLFLSDREKP
jgi:Glutamyl-tRNAGlu reductase, dimerisation domain